MLMFPPQTLFKKTYTFTTECIDRTNNTVLEELQKNPSYCVDNICWDRKKFPFCVCVSTDASENKSDKTGCDKEHLNASDPYLPEDYVVFDGSFGNILLGTVRLMVHLSTENFPDFIREHFQCFYI